MSKAILMAAALALATAGGASAATFGGKSRDLPANFTSRLTAVCQSPTLVLTVSAKTACMTGAFPRVTTAATAFVNTGTGAELNTLMRQLPPAVAAK